MAAGRVSAGRVAHRNDLASSVRRLRRLFKGWYPDTRNDPAEGMLIAIGLPRGVFNDWHDLQRGARAALPSRGVIRKPGDR
jgi:hypothetical protein